QVIEPGIDQLHRENEFVDPPGNLLVSGHVAADTIAGNETGAAEERIAGALEEHALGKVFHLEAVGGKPGIEVGRFASTHLMSEARAEETRLENEPGVGGEDQ